jgi:hypothetical protein
MARFEFSFSKYGESFSSFQIRKGPSIIGTGDFCFFFFVFGFWVVGAQEDMTFCLRLCRFVLQQRWVVGWWWCRWRGAAEIELNA